MPGRVARFKVLDNVLVSGVGPTTANQVSNAIAIDPSNGFFSLETLMTGAGTSHATLYYEITNDGGTHYRTALATAGASTVAGGSVYNLDGFDPPVCQAMRIRAIGTGTNTTSNRLTAWLNFTENK